jgi:hypothetical protein
MVDELEQEKRASSERKQRQNYLERVTPELIAKKRLFSAWKGALHGRIAAVRRHLKQQQAGDEPQADKFPSGPLPVDAPLAMHDQARGTMLPGPGAGCKQC